MKRIVPAIVTAVAAASCGGSNSPPAPGNPPSTTLERLAWTQEAPSKAAVDGYGFTLFVDGTGNTLASATCTGTAPMFECSAPFPQVPSGRHVLELSAVDRSTGLESAHSGQLVVGQSASIATRTIAVAGPSTRTPAEGGDSVAAEPDVPRETCVDNASPTCFDISVVADNVGAVERLVSLPDGRLLAVYGTAIVRILPDGLAERLEIDRPGDATIADVAVDRDFLTNRFVYFATTAPTTSGRRGISIVRMREVAGRFGEAATVAADLPADGGGNPAISVDPDARLYIALPAAQSGRSTDAAYDGLVLRLTREGAAAGYERMNSPILAFGSPRPSSLGWLGDRRLLLASSNGTAAVALGIVPVAPGEAWPAPITPLHVPDASRFAEGIKEVAADSPSGANAPVSRLYLLGVDPPVLYAGRLALTGTAADVVSLDPIPLGQLLPVTFALSDDGSLLVAARQRTDPHVRLLRLQARR